MSGCLSYLDDLPLMSLLFVSNDMKQYSENVFLSAMTNDSKTKIIVFTQPAIGCNYFRQSVVVVRMASGRKLPPNLIFSQAVFSLTLGVHFLLL